MADVTVIQQPIEVIAEVVDAPPVLITVQGFPTVSASVIGIQGPPGADGAGAWGDITGTLSDQTDLQTALDAKQPLDSDLTTIAGLTATSDNFMQAKAGAWASRTVAQVKTDLGLSGTNSGDQTSIVGITGTKAQFDTAVTDGNVQWVGDAPTAHTHLLAAGATDVTMTAANLNTLDDGINTTLHFHDADRARANHTGTQLAATISDFSTAVAATAAVTANTAKVTNATHTGDVTGSGALTIANNAVTNAKAADMATARIKGRVTAATGDPEDLTGTQATTLLDAFTSALKGLAPASGGGSTNYLRADGTWAAPPGSGLTDGDKGDVVVSSSGTVWTVETSSIFGVNTNGTSTRRLSVQSAESQFSHDGTSHTMRINKSSGLDDAKIQFTSALSARAELGLIGSTDTTLRTSPDGSTWNTALTVSTAGVMTAALPMVLAASQVVNGVTLSTSATAAASLRGDGTYSTTLGVIGVIIEDQKASGTSGGTFTNGADRTRDLNTLVYNGLGIAALASNQFTLPAGTYYIRWEAPAQGVALHQSFLYNVTDASEVKRGTPNRATTPAPDGVFLSSGSTVVTIAGSKAFEIRHRCATTQAGNGFGQAAAFGTEVYTRVEITRLA